MHQLKSSCLKKCIPSLAATLSHLAFVLCWISPEPQGGISLPVASEVQQRGDVGKKAASSAVLALPSRAVETTLCSSSCSIIILDNLSKMEAVQKPRASASIWFRLILCSWFNCTYDLRCCPQDEDCVCDSFGQLPRSARLNPTLSESQRNKHLEAADRLRHDLGLQPHVRSLKGFESSGSRASKGLSN